MEALSKVRAHGSSSLMCVCCRSLSGAVQLQVQWSLPLKAVQLFKAFIWTSEDLRQKGVLLLLSVLCLVLSWLAWLTFECYFSVQFLSSTGELSQSLTQLAKTKKKKKCLEGCCLLMCLVVDMLWIHSQEAEFQLTSLARGSSSQWELGEKPNGGGLSALIPGPVENDSGITFHGPAAMILY